MPVRLITGPVGSGKTSYLLDLLRTSREPEALLYVVPTTHTAGELRRNIIRNRERPLLGDIFISWNQFLRSIAGLNRPSISSYDLTLFIYQLLRDHPLRYFNTKTISIGIAREFATTIMALKTNLIDPTTLRYELETCGSLRENDLLTLYERYEKEHQRLGIIDEGDVAKLAYFAIRDDNFSALNNRTIVIDEFYSFPPGVLTIIQQLARDGNDVDLWLSHPETTDPAAPYAGLWSASCESLEALADHRERLRETGDRARRIESYSLRSPTMEARYIARSLSLISADKSFREHTGVVLRRDDDFLSIILSECSRYGLGKEELTANTPLDAPIIHLLLSQEHLTELDHQGTVGEFARRLTETLSRIDILQRGGKDLAIPDRRIAVSRSLSAIGMLNQLLRSLTTKAQLYNLGTISRRSFVELLHHALGIHTSWNIHNTSLPFTVHPFESPPPRSLSTTFVPRLIDGHLPQTLTERMFFGDIDNFLDIFENSERQLARETALFHAIIQKTIDTVVFTHPVMDDRGNEAIPSSFLDNHGHALAVDIPPDIAPDRKSYAFEQRLARTIGVERARFQQSEEYPDYQGFITKRAVKDIVRQRFVASRLSPTSLERYAACPFQFFAEKVLGLKAEEEITPEIQPKDRGTIIHALLERFYRDHIADFRRLIEDPTHDKGLERIIDELVDRVFVEHASLIGYASPSLDTYQRRAVKTLALQEIRMELARAREVPEPLLPAHCEWCFGEGEDEPLKVEVPKAPDAMIKGRVDRIDTTNDGRRFAVIDYKTGSSVGSVKNDITKGLHLQLPLYVEAARRLFMRDAEPVGGLLIGVQQAEKKHGFLRKNFNEINYSLSNRLATLLGDEAWNELLNAALTHTGSYIAEIRNGRFTPRPRECSNFCDYKDVCRHHEDID